jgi:hypothetical protein
LQGNENSAEALRAFTGSVALDRHVTERKTELRLQARGARHLCGDQLGSDEAGNA